MKYVIIASAIAIGLSSSAYASDFIGSDSCRPSISITGESGMEHNGDSMDYYTKERDNSISFTLNIPLGTKVCKQAERESLYRTTAERRAQEIDNLERMIALCTEYGFDHPMLIGRCN